MAVSRIMLELFNDMESGLQLGGIALLAVVKSVGMIGLEGYIVDVEVDISNGLPGLDIVGLAGTAVKESKERVRAAVKNSGLEFPLGRITVNLAPADQKKEGPVFDLPIAVGLLAASGQLENDRYKEYAFFGELSLDGSVRGVTGILPGVMTVRDKTTVKGVIVPAQNADEAALVEKMDVYPVDNLQQVINFINGRDGIKRHTVDLKNLIGAGSRVTREDMADVYGQFKVKRALEVAAAGGHNLIMIGPPGSGKTMMARRLAHIIPELTFEESLEITKIYSVAGLLKNNLPLIINRPFRSPHHSVSKSGIIGGGALAKPGELSLAHYGILFMDEFPEFNKDTLESLRQPIEEGRVCISRVNYSVEYPAKIILVAAMNPCPCGFLGDESKECTCTPAQIMKYRNRISGPLLDRIDIHVEVPRIKYQDLQGNLSGDSSDKIRKRVKKARLLQQQRFLGTGMKTNSEMGSKEVRRYCKINGKAASLIQTAFEKLHLSARGYSRVLKVARTIADLEGVENINENHIAEAIQYRCIDRGYR